MNKWNTCIIIVSKDRKSAFCTTHKSEVEIYGRTIAPVCELEFKHTCEENTKIETAKLNLVLSVLRSQAPKLEG